MTYLHGISVTEEIGGSRPVQGLSIATIGLVATAPDADADVFPLNKAVLFTDIRKAIAAAGDEGTLAKALRTIADQINPVIIVVRVAPGANADELEDNVIGATAGNAYTGMQALLAAEAQLKVRPRIIGAPGLDTPPVGQALAALAVKLRGFAYIHADGADDEAAAVDFREAFGQREAMILWPDFSGWEGQAVAAALGTRARIDAEVGPHKSISNVVVNGVTGLSHDVHFDPRDANTGANLLNANQVTTLVQRSGHRFWGSRTCTDEPLFAFEPSVRMNYLLQDTIAEGLLWAIDKPLTKGLITDILETIRAELRRLVQRGWLIGANAWFDPAKNSAEQLAGGGLTISYDFTVPAPAEQIGLISTITGDYYAALVSDLG